MKRGWHAALGVLVALIGSIASSDANAVDQGTANAQCQAKIGTFGNATCHARWSTLFSMTGVNCAHAPNVGANPPSGWYHAQIQCSDQSGPRPWDTVQSYSYSGSCFSRPAHSSGWIETTDPNAFEACSDGCTFIDNDGTATYKEVNGKTFVEVTGWIPEGTTCNAATTVTTPPPDADSDGVSDDLDDFPNDPNETSDSDGDGIGDNADFADDDPTDGRDTPGEEDGDDEGDNIASGGGDCNAPPTCSGDGIQCAQLYQQWRTRCALESSGVDAGGSCASPYVCSGDPVQCAQLNEARLARCELEEGSTGGSGPDNDYTLPDPGVGAGDSLSDEHPSVDGLFDNAAFEALIAQGGDESGFGLPRTCPWNDLPDVVFRGATYVLPWEQICTAMAVLGGIILIAGHIQWAYIVGKTGS